MQQIQPTPEDLSELQQSSSDQRHLQQTYQKLQQQLIAKTKPLILSNAQQVNITMKMGAYIEMQRYKRLTFKK